MGMFIELRAEDGFLSRGYLALPPAGTGPGIIVQQEIFGLNRQIRGICDLLADEGYVALAPDLFARLERDVELGYTPPEFEKALALYARFDDEHGLADIGAAIAALRVMPEVVGGRAPKAPDSWSSGAGVRCSAFNKAHFSHRDKRLSTPKPRHAGAGSARSRATSVRVSWNICRDTF
jgi:hypothetical protein